MASRHYTRAGSGRSTERPHPPEPYGQHEEVRVVPPVGLEPTLPCGNLILSQARLPIPPRGHAGRLKPSRRPRSTDCRLSWRDARVSGCGQSSCVSSQHPHQAAVERHDAPPSPSVCRMRRASFVRRSPASKLTASPGSCAAPSPSRFRACRTVCAILPSPARARRGVRPPNSCRHG